MRVAAGRARLGFDPGRAGAVAGIRHQSYADRRLGRGAMMKSNWIMAFGVFATGLSSTTLRAETIGRVTGVGGVFVTSKDPKALTAWYRDVLGIAIEPWGGAILRYDAPGHPPMALWNAMPENSDEIAPSRRDFMINFAVDDLDAFVARLEKKGVKILNRQSDKTGKFAWILDPDGTKIELWQAVGK
jgi:predicted enzyme related to lactoylglutathione lyase